MTVPAVSGTTPRVARGVVLRVLLRPDLWWTACGVLVRMARPGWWRRPPYLPWPDDRLWAFRMVTAYGDPGAVPPPDDVISFLEWCRGTRRPGRAFGGGPGPTRLQDASRRSAQAKFPD
jgi:hypothetical protein